MAIKYNTEISEQTTNQFNNKLEQLKTEPIMATASYSNLYGVTKGITANNEYLSLSKKYKSSFTQFSNQIKTAAQKFDELDKSEAIKMGGEK